jgi:hypothetical protein
VKQRSHTSAPPPPFLPVPAARTDTGSTEGATAPRTPRSTWSSSPECAAINPPRAYVARRTAEGLSKTDIMRCLKRLVAREIYYAIRADFQAAHWCSIRMSLISDGSVMRPRCRLVIAQLA